MKKSFDEVEAQTEEAEEKEVPGKVVVKGG
jgi:hypothetical protein